MCLLAALDSQGIVVKCTAAIFFRTVDCNVLLNILINNRFIRLNKDPDYKRDSSSHFCRTVTSSTCINDGGHAEQVESKRSRIGISRNKGKCI